MGGRGSPTLLNCCPLFPTPIPCLFIFLRTLLRFFALCKITTLFFSRACALFHQKNTGCGRPTSWNVHGTGFHILEFGAVRWQPGGSRLGENLKTLNRALLVSEN